MRILQIVTLANLGGAQSVVINLANSFAKDNTVAIVSAEEGPMWKMLSPSIQQYRIDTLIRRISFRHDLQTIFKLRNVYNEFKPDIIHLHSSKIGLLGRLCLPSNRIVYTVHGFDSIRIAFRKFLAIEKFFQKKAEAIVAVSEYDRENLIKEGIKHNVHTVYNGLEDISASHVNFELGNPKKTVLCIARLDPQKDYYLFNQIARLLPQYNFVWIGNHKAPDFPVSDNTYWLGEVANASTYFSVADLCLLTSNYEGLPMSIIEAMAYSKPIVASDVGGISEIVINDYNGYVLPNKEEAFAEKIQLILEDEQMLKKFGIASRCIYEKKLTVQKMASKYLQLYKNILGL